MIYPLLPGIQPGCMVRTHVRRAHPEPVARDRHQAAAKTKQLRPRTERFCEKLQNRPLFAVPLSLREAQVAEEQNATHPACLPARAMRRMPARSQEKNQPG
jgi:hypothetical protein